MTGVVDVVGVVGVVALAAAVGVSDPPLQPARTPTVTAKKRNAENLEIFRLKEF